MFDLIIIGGGPAGSAAAVYAARKQMKTCLISPAFGGQSDVSPEIFNWIGTPSISGTDLAKSLETHVRTYEGEFLDILTGQQVTSVMQKDASASPIFTVTTHKGEVFETRAVLLATGSGRRKLTIPGADIFENKGIVYCASCDGPLFSGQEVVVIGGGNAGFETAAQLSAYCKQVTLLNRSATYRADEITVKKVLEKENVTGICNALPEEIQGEQFVKNISYRNTLTQEKVTLPVTGVFVEIGQIPNTHYISDQLVALTEYKQVIIDPWTQRSSCLGIWAAGDIANIRYHQNNIAAGDGVKAVEDIYLYLHTGV